MLEKVYKVEFMSYSDALKATVKTHPENGEKEKYLEVGKEHFLVRESELEKFKVYGYGFRSVTFVGNMDV